MDEQLYPTMERFIFVFGFETPREREINERFGSDSECSISVQIDAPDEATALAWGQEIAERFVKELYKDAAVSWREWGYASWIENRPDEQERHRQQSSVSVGEFPDFGPWLQYFSER